MEKSPIYLRKPLCAYFICFLRKGKTIKLKSKYQQLHSLAKLKA